MNPENLSSCLLIGNNLGLVLFKTAIYFAENGLKVWFISPVTIVNIPEDLPTPNKEVLKFITFLYLENHYDLLEQLNNIQLWHKQPNLIILNGFEKYCNFNCDMYNPLIAGSLCACLLDNAAASNINDQTRLLVTCEPLTEKCLNKLNVLIELYFPNVFQNCDNVYNKVIEHFSI